MLGWEEIIGRFLLAFAIGALIGWERERNQRPAGLRTHMLVCAGSAMCMMIGYYSLAKSNGHGSIDPTRIAAQVISGIGFLGAGTILREGLSVKGLTTAASLWTVACLGLAVGAGYYFAAIVGAVLMFLTLTLVERVEHCMIVNLKNRVYFTIESRQMIKALSNIHRIAREKQMSVGEIKITERLTAEKEQVNYLTFQMEASRFQRKNVDWSHILREFEKVEGITGVEMEEL